MLNFKEMQQIGAALCSSTIFTGKEGESLIRLQAVIDILNSHSEYAKLTLTDKAPSFFSKGKASVNLQELKKEE